MSLLRELPDTLNTAMEEVYLPLDGRAYLDPVDIRCGRLRPLQDSPGSKDCVLQGVL